MPHATVCTQITITAHNTQGFFCHYLRAVSVTSCSVASPNAVLLVFHYCIATLAGGTSQRIFEDCLPMSSSSAFSIMMKFIISPRLVFSGDNNIASAKNLARNTMVFYPQKY